MLKHFIKIPNFKLIFALFFAMIIAAYSQHDYNGSISNIESILERISDETGSSPTIDEIDRFIEHPLYLATATVSEIIQIPGFTTLQAKKLIELLNNNHDCTYEIIERELNFSKEQIFILKICTTFDQLYKEKSNSVNYRIRNQSYLSNMPHLSDSSIAGNSLNLYQRLTAYYDEYSFGLLVNKSAGEKSILDFVGGYLTGNIYNTNIIIGDYYVQSGLGNILWQSYGYGKGSDVVYSPVQYTSAIKPYRSSMEYDYFRGIAIEKSWFEGFDYGLKSMLWFSAHPRSASLDSAKDNITSIYNSSYFRTPNELKKRNTLHETALGGSLEYKYHGLTIGATAVGLDYSKEIVSKAKTSFNGKSGILSSVYSNVLLNDYQFNIELSRDAKNNLAISGGGLYTSKHIEATTHIRSFSKDFRAPNGYNFGESTTPANETGWYSGINIKAIKKLSWSSYFDIYRYSLRSDGVDEYGLGYDYFSEAEYYYNKNQSLCIRFRHENKNDVRTLNDGKEIYRKYKSKYRIEYLNHMQATFNYCVRVEAISTSYDNGEANENGIGGLFSIGYNLTDYLMFSSLISRFSTDSYESAFWLYSAPEPGNISTLGLYGNGWYGYISMAIKFRDNLNVHLRYSYMKRYGVEKLSSDILEIIGNEDKRLFLQLDIRL